MVSLKIMDKIRAKKEDKLGFYFPLPYDWHNASLGFWDHRLVRVPIPKNTKAVIVKTASLL